VQNDALTERLKELSSQGKLPAEAASFIDGL
jgi:hypothetical protein